MSGLDGYCNLGEQLFQAKRAELAALQQKKQDLIAELQRMETEHNSQLITYEDANNMLDALPLKTLRDVYELETTGKLKSGFMKIMKHKYKLRKEFAKKQEELDSIILKIELQQVEVALANVRALEEKLG